MKKFVAILLSVLMAAALVTGCASDNNSNQSGDNGASGSGLTLFPAKDINTEQVKIAYIPNSTAGSVHEVSHMAARDIIFRYPNVEINFFDSAFDSAIQIQQVSECIAQKYDAILMEVTDAVALNSVIREAEEAGVVVITTNQTCTTVHSIWIETSAYYAGWEVGKLLVDDLGGNGNVILFDCPAPLVPVVLHGKGFQDYIASYPGINMIDYANIDAFSQENSFQAMRDMLTKHDNIDAVYAMGDDMAIGVIQAIEQANRQGDGIYVYGSEGVVQAIEAIRDGRMRATVWGDRYTMLYTAFNMALLYIQQGTNSVALGLTETPQISMPFYPITQSNVDRMVPYIRYSALWS